VVHPLQLFDDFGYLMEPTDEPVDVILLADRVVPATRPQAGSSR
jgi:hypothetical protein